MPRSTDENEPLATDPELDLFDPKNGPPYCEDFVKRYRSAQVARNNAITDWAERELKRVRAGGLLRSPVHRAAHLGRPANGRSHPRADQAARRTCVTSASPTKANRSTHGIAAASTLRSWLGMWSLRHAQTRAEPHLARIDCPALVINAEQDTGVYPSDAKRIYDALASSDKTQRSVDTDHYFTTPGARSEKADTIAKWIAKRWR